MNKTSHPDRFWERIPLDRMSREQWESLCDGCAQCCLHRLEDEETHEIHFTNVVCDLLDLDSGRCRDYPNRSTRVPACVTLTPAELDDPYWLPPSCAYRRLAEGRPLPDWHPLVADGEAVFLSAKGLRGRVVRETDADELEFHLVDWI